MSSATGQLLRKLFVTNLPWTVGNRELKLYFSKYGMVNSVNVIYNKSNGMSRGFGFVEFAKVDGYINATAEPVHRLEGRVLAVQPSTS